MMSPEDSQNMTGLSAPKKRTHRGRRGRGSGSNQHHADAKEHMANAQAASTPDDARKHLFKALSSISKATKATPTQQSSVDDSPYAC